MTAIDKILLTADASAKKLKLPESTVRYYADGLRNKQTTTEVENRLAHNFLDHRG